MTDVLLILRWSHSSILMCYWFSGSLIPAYWCVIDSHVTSSQHTDVLLILRLPHSSHISMLEWVNLRINNTSVCWNEVTWESITHASVCWNEITWESITHQYAEMRSPLHHSSLLMCYWFSGYLIPAYWCVIDSHVTSFQHTDVLLILRLPHSSILMCYWFSGYLIPAYGCVIDSHVTSF
jgi:hypothetical protein